MDIKVNLYNILIAFGMLQSFIFGFYLSFRSKLKGAQFYLGITVIFLSSYIFWVLKYDFGFEKYFPHLRLFPIFFISGIGPAFYIYLRFLFNKPISGFKIRLFFIPLLIQFVYYISTIAIYWVNHWDYRTFNTFESTWVFNSASVEHLYGLSFFGIFLYKSYRLVLKSHMLYATNKIKTILICFIILWSIWVVYSFFDTLYYDFAFPPSGFYLFYILFTALTYAIGFFGFKINNDTFLRVGFKSEAKTEGKTANKEMTDIFQNILELMATSKPYLDPSINLTSFSEQLKLHPNKVSAAINIMSKSSFRDFINTYRINEFISNSSTYDFETKTILGLAYEVGFNSKSSFNRAFKKFTNSSPVEYLQKIKE
ncbi:AraC family transcriptional regulator [Winogradskyella sp.]|uniref:helix-turn-helix domain-containing protein n=1 Tax=Winogradskyella sp. TaxID=1883156 RepID=UPI0026197369|nr:AraC family transcriptional regulator [Winogradskyella sp.]